MADFLQKLSDQSGTLNPTAMFPNSSIGNILNDHNSQYRASIVIAAGNQGPSNGAMVQVVGICNEPPVIEVSAEWEASGLLEAVVGNIPLVNTIYKYSTSLAGAGGLTNPSELGVSSQKIYNKSGYLMFDMKMRVVDWKGDGCPLSSSTILSNLCLPTQMGSSTSLSDFVVSATNIFTKLGSMGRMNKEQVQEYIDKAKEIAATGAKTLYDASEGPLKAELQAIGKAANLAVNDPQFFVTASSPLPVAVNIGTWFSRDDLLVTSVKTTFSKQMTEHGPLYADFDMSFSSRRALMIGSNEAGLGMHPVLPSFNRITMA